MPTDYDAETALRPALRRGERLLWAGRPRQGVIFRSADAFLIPFSILWLCFAVFWVLSAAGAGAPLFFLVFGGVFVLAGIHFAVGRFFLDARARRNTLYGITTERVIIRAGTFRRTLKSLQLRTLSDVTLEESGTDEGTILFGAGQIPALVRFNPWLPRNSLEPPMFERIPDIRRVYDILTEAQNKT